MNHDPIFVETCSCGKSIRTTSDDLLRNGIKPVMWRKLCAVQPVLSGNIGINEHIIIKRPLNNSYCILKLFLQKRIRNKVLERKSPRMHFKIGLQWALSGNQVVWIGNTILILVKGNRKSGNGFVRIREILLDLRLKVYCCESQTIPKN